MVWDRAAPQGNESGKIKWEIVKWTRGRGLDLGCGYQKTFPHFIGVDSGKDQRLFGNPCNADVWVETAGELPMFASGSMDFLFSSHLLEHFPLEHQDIANHPNPIARAMHAKLAIEKCTAVEALREWMRILKRDGYLVLYVPDEDTYPKVGEEGANPDHCFNCSYQSVLELMGKTGCSYDLVDFQKRSEGNEYSLFFVFKKTGSGRHESWRNLVRAPKTCGLVRYGAYGDLLQCSSVLHALHDEGFTTTLYTSPPGHDVILHDPHVADFYLQDRDQVPNPLLGEFWAYHAKKFDRWVNLSESVEGNLLAMPGKSNHWWRPAARHKLMNLNYVEVQHLIAGVKPNPRVKFYSTETERDWARRERSKLGGAPLVLWSLSGSSVHKTWGGLDRTMASILTTYPTSHIVLVGGPECQVLEQGWQNEGRVKLRSGKYSIRETLSLLEFVDVVIGPETGVVNAASQLPCPKVLFLSHSTHENLSRDWTNVFSIGSLHTVCPGRGENEAPACHQMHFGWDHCKQYRKEGDPQDGTAQCQADIDGEAAWALIRAAIDSTITAQIERVS